MNICIYGIYSMDRLSCMLRLREDILRLLIFCYQEEQILTKQTMYVASAFQNNKPRNNVLIIVYDRDGCIPWRTIYECLHIPYIICRMARLLCIKLFPKDMQISSVCCCQEERISTEQTLTTRYVNHSTVIAWRYSSAYRCSSKSFESTRVFAVKRSGC